MDIRKIAADVLSAEQHDSDDQCTLDPETGMCTECGALYDAEGCPECGQHFYHKPDCPRIDDPWGRNS